MKTRLTKNALKCRMCGWTIESKSRHDFKFCDCGSIFVDGGLDYARSGGTFEHMEDLCEWEECDE